MHTDEKALVHLPMMLWMVFFPESLGLTQVPEIASLKLGLGVEST